MTIFYLNNSIRLRRSIVNQQSITLAAVRLPCIGFKFLILKISIKLKGANIIQSIGFVLWSLIQISNNAGFSPTQAGLTI